MPALTSAVEHTSLRHGYSLADIDKLTMIAVFRDFWHQSMDIDERRDLAWSAIVERLYSSEQHPTRRDLIQAAQQAIDTQLTSQCTTRGISRQNGYIPMPNFWRFWWEHTRHSPGPEERIVDRTALWQIWCELPSRYQQVLLALATHDDHNLAAQSLGISREAYTNTLSKARRAFYELWHEGERPSRLWGPDHRGCKGTDTHSIASGIIRRRQKYRRARAQAAAADK